MRLMIANHETNGSPLASVITLEILDVFLQKLSERSIDPST